MTSGLSHHWSQAQSAPSRVIVLGSRGFVGSAVVSEFRHHGIDCLGISSAEIDLQKPNAVQLLLERLQPGDALVISSTLTPDRGKDTATFMKNVRMAEMICSAIAEKPVAHVIYIGSDAVYPDNECYPDNTSFMDEATRMAPGALYGLMHAARELMLRSVFRGPIAFLRPTLLYGAADTHNAYGPNRFRRSAMKEERILLFGSGEEKRDHVYIADVARIVRMVVERRSEGILNIVTGRSTSFREVADLVAAQFPHEVRIVEQPRSGRAVVTHRHYAVEALKRAFPGFCPVSLEEGTALAHSGENRG